jgi:CxxC motif-containing protein (DUF1111 family)
MNKISTIIFCAVFTAIAAGSAFVACKSSTSASPVSATGVDTTLAYSGGALTVFSAGSGAFGFSAPNLDANGQSEFGEGSVAFNTSFVSSPSPVFHGLGPVFNNVSCVSCHLNDGGGVPPDEGGQLNSLLIRISMPGTDQYGGPNPVPGFGGQLQQRAIPGIQPEADVNVTYAEINGAFTDGTPYSLRKPIYMLMHPYAPFPGEVLVSPRITPAIFGLGLLEAVPEQTILANAVASSDDNSGIHGHPNYVWDNYYHKMMIGRFGLKANTATLYQQTAAAYQQDMGITSYIFPQEACAGQPQAAGAKDSGGVEVDSATLNAVVFYHRTLAVPARRNVTDPTNDRGEIIFYAAKCANCHTPTLTTGTLDGVPEVANQTIHPYTDLLLHDMGPGLADNRPDYQASGTEWRTSPLWGIGLRQVVTGQAFYLHDGRARTLMEAILWHGGEAQFSKNYILNLPGSDRDALISFLNSL